MRTCCTCWLTTQVRGAVFELRIVSHIGGSES
jgi:hypothetical protein